MEKIISQAVSGTTDKFFYYSINHTVKRLALPRNQSSDAVALDEAAPTIVMVPIKGGIFTMGATPEQGRDSRADESPARQVTVSDFYMGRYVVTQAQWEAVMGSNPSEFRREPTLSGDFPVERVSWHDAQKFIRRLNARTGMFYRLPTEAEWEYAARGGCVSRGYKYSGAARPEAVAWYKEVSDAKTHSVGQKESNELGLYDMCGNVWEWVEDWYGAYSDAAQINPAGPQSGWHRVIRGGSWGSLAEFTRVTARFSHAPDSRSGGIGFRLACSARTGWLENHEFGGRNSGRRQTALRLVVKNDKS